MTRILHPTVSPLVSIKRVPAAQVVLSNQIFEAFVHQRRARQVARQYELLRCIRALTN